MTEKKETVMQSIKRITLLDVATEALRDAILNGEVGLGERVNENAFTTKFNISRTTFREALRQLEQAGLLVRDPYRGTFVREFSDDEIRDLNNLRGALETYAAEIVIESGHNGEKDLLPLYQVVAQMEGIDPQEDAAQTNALHIAFHRTLLNMTGNKALLSVWNDLAQQFWVVMRVSQLTFIKSGEAGNFADAHREVVDAIAAGDEDLVRKIMRRHVS